MTFHRLSASAITNRPSAAYEYIRAARGILVEIWTDLEGRGEFPQVLVSRMMEIEKGLASVEKALHRDR